MLRLAARSLGAVVTTRAALGAAMPSARLLHGLAFGALYAKKSGGGKAANSESGAAAASFDMAKFEREFAQAQRVLADQLALVRAGRASPGMSSAITCGRADVLCWRADA